MRCTNKAFLTLLFSLLFIITGCSSKKYAIPYTADSKISSFRIAQTEAVNYSAPGFASKLCVSDKDVANNSIKLEDGIGAGLFNINDHSVIYAKNLHEHFNPASLTKIMTAIVAIKNGNIDMTLTATPNVKNLDSGAQAIGLNPGDTMTLEQALNILLVYSANDVAILIAEGIAGSEEAFVEMMNQEAIEIGATNSHFDNCHGLTSENHYVTPYDLYLMMNKATQYELFNQIIGLTEYSTSYNTIEGLTKEISVKATNLYLTGAAESPNGITIVGGKTGTTSAAGHCLVILSRDTKSNPYISIILKDTNRDNLYKDMTNILNAISN